MGCVEFEDSLHLISRESVDIGDPVLGQLGDGFDESLSRDTFVYGAAILALTHVIDEAQKDFFNWASGKALEIERATLRAAR